MARSKAKNLGPWCRLYATILDNPKLERLSDSVFRGHVKMMAIATVYGGMIPLDLNDVAIRLRKPIGKVRDLIQILLSGNLLERTAEGYIIHDWVEMQFDSDVSTGRVKQFRERQKASDETPVKRFSSVAETPDETAPYTEADTETEDCSLRSQSSAAAPPAVPKPKFVLPDWVPKEAWEGFVEMRRRKGSFTARAMQLTIEKLEKLLVDDTDITAVLDQSVQRGWTGVFPVKPETSNGSGHKPTAHENFQRGTILALENLKRQRQ